MLRLGLRHWINDGLMAIFFFGVGLEIKCEFLVGELAERRKAMLPIVAAVGSMVVPALIYSGFNFNGARHRFCARRTGRRGLALLIKAAGI